MKSKRCVTSEKSIATREDHLVTPFCFCRTIRDGRCTSSAYVLRPDGSLRDPDEKLQMADNAGITNYVYIWRKVAPDDLVLIWRFPFPDGPHEFDTRQVPEEITPEQLATTHELEVSKAREFDYLVNYTDDRSWDTSCLIVGTGWNLDPPILTQAQLIELVNRTQARLNNLPEGYNDCPSGRVSMTDGWHFITREKTGFERSYALTQFEVERWVAQALAYEKYVLIIERRRKQKEKYLPRYLKLASQIEAAGGEMQHIGPDGMFVHLNGRSEIYGFNCDDLLRLNNQLTNGASVS